MNERFWKLLEPIHGQAENFGRRLVGNRDDGDDLYQEAVLSALAKFETLRDEDAFKRWFYRILINVHKNRRRLPWLRKAVGWGESVSEPTRDPSPEYDARRHLNIAFSALRLDDRALVVLYELEGWSIRELAALYGSPEGTIKARLWRARHKMRKALIPHERIKTEREDGYELPESSAEVE
jgi:RNA polymerase sigma-70 factor (ECF subfamily)